MSSTPKAVVIGTGAAGLVASAYLARDGFEVVALERAEELGGYLNPFARRRYHFDPGVHYMGECEPGGLVYETLAPLGLDVPAMFCELDADGIDRYRFPDLEVRLCKGKERFRAHLAETFPDAGRCLDRFFRALDRLGELLGAFGSLMSRRLRLADIGKARHLPQALRWGLGSYDAFLRWVTSDLRLRAVLAAPLGAIGLPPSRVSALIGLGMFHHFVGGAYFPKGGSGAMRDAIADVARAAGADMRVRAEVKRIRVEDGAARGVILRDGEQLDADVVVSAIEPTVTFGSLIELGRLPARLGWKVMRTEPSLGSFYVFLGLKRDLRAHGLGAANLWYYPTYDMEEVYRPAMEGRVGEDFALIASPNSLKDTSGALAPEGCSTLEVMTLMAYEPFERWDGLPSYKRGEEYRRLKERVGEQVLAQFCERFPGVVGDVEVKEFGTPVTNAYWVGAVRGGAYGPAMSIGQTGPFRYQTKTPVHNLLLAGSGVFGCGVASCFLSGMVAAKKARGALRAAPAAAE